MDISKLKIGSWYYVYGTMFFQYDGKDEEPNVIRMSHYVSGMLIYNDKLQHDDFWKECKEVDEYYMRTVLSKEVCDELFPIKNYELWI